MTSRRPMRRIFLEWGLVAVATAIPILLSNGTAGASVAWFEFVRPPSGVDAELYEEWSESFRLE